MLDDILKLTRDSKEVLTGHAREETVLPFIVYR